MFNNCSVSALVVSFFSLLMLPHNLKRDFFSFIDGLAQRPWITELHPFDVSAALGYFLCLFIFCSTWRGPSYSRGRRQCSEVQLVLGKLTAFQQIYQMFLCFCNPSKMPVSSFPIRLPQEGWKTYCSYCQQSCCCCAAVEIYVTVPHSNPTADPQLYWAGSKTDWINSWRIGPLVGIRYDI